MLRGPVADFRCISAAGKTIERLLNACFEADQPIGNNRPTHAILVRSEDFNRPNEQSATIPGTALSIFLYRVEVNKVMRAAWSSVASVDGQVHLPLDLHYLLTAWADNAEWEQQILGKAMQCLEASPSLTGPMLYPTAGWTANEAIHLIVEDLGIDSLMRTFDSLALDYRLSVPYLARIVRLDGKAVEPPASSSTVITGLTPVGALP
jgi:uncharacterized protein DUF4255